MKFIQSRLFYFLVGAFISESIVFAATTISADKIEYAQNVSIKDKIDELYIKASFGNATANDITYGKTALVNGKQITGTYTNTANKVVIETPNKNVEAYTHPEFKTGFQPKLIYIEAIHSGETHRIYWAEGSDRCIYQYGSSINSKSLNGTTGSQFSLTINSDGFLYYPGNWDYTITYYYVAG